MIDGDSGVMNQADALLKYLAHKYPNALLGDNGTLQNAYELDRWLAFLTGDVHPAFFPFFAPQRYTTDDSQTNRQSVKEASYRLIDRVYQHLDKHLEGKDHLVGDRRMIADPSLCLCDDALGQQLEANLAKLSPGASSKYDYTLLR